MATSLEQGNRRVVPRWRSFDEAIAMRELDPTYVISPALAEGSEFLHEKEEEWREHRGLYHALDLVSASHVLGQSLVANEAAEFVLSESRNVSELALNLAADLIGTNLRAPKDTSIDGGKEYVGFRIHELKQRRLVEPRNAFVWADMARLYVVLGMSKQAEKPMQIALALAPFDRLILRCAARFYLHTERPEQALALLRNAGRTAFDPWLIASEIAISSILEKGPKFAGIAEKMLANRESAPFHLSEMAAALASTEMWSGHSGGARKLFSVAMEDPAENALAQRVWAARELGLGDITIEQMQNADAFEARALAAKDQNRWGDAVRFSKLWAETESFSHRPYGYGSSIISSILGDFESGEKFAREGLLTNPHHPALINNIAFSLTEAGDPEAARKEWRKADTANADINSKLCLLATAGLIEYRSGYPEEGRRCYEQALAYSVKTKDRIGRATAQLYYAREEIRLGSKEYIKMFDTAVSELKRIKEPYSLAVATKVCKDIGRDIGTIPIKLDFRS